MAVGWFERLAVGGATGWSGGSEPGQGIDAVRPIRDDTERRVRALLAELDVPVA